MKRETTMIKDIIGFSGAIYNTEYAMMCQPMTRIDTPLQYAFTAFICSEDTATANGNGTNYRCGRSGE